MAVERIDSSYTSNEAENARLTYDYSTGYLRSRRELIGEGNRRLTTFIGFSGLLLRFAIDLPGGDSVAVTAKTLAICFSGAASVAACLGLWPKPTGQVLDALELFEDEWFDKESPELLIAVAKEQAQLAEDLRPLELRRQLMLCICIVFLVLGLIAFAVSALAGTLN